MNPLLPSLVCVLSPWIFAAEWAPGLDSDAEGAGARWGGSCLPEELPTAHRIEAPVEGPVTLRFLGRIDGSDRLHLDGDGARWEHLHWSHPIGNVMLGNVAWNPSERPRVGADVIHPSLGELDFEGARLRRIHGRGTVALESGSEGLTVHLSDAQNGSDLYEFELELDRVDPRYELRIAAKIDGSDELHIDAGGAYWVHREWGWPHGPVVIDDFAWSVGPDNTIVDAGHGVPVPADTDFSTARVVSRKGRDLVALEASSEGIVVHFSDTPNGSDDYEIHIRFDGPRNDRLASRTSSLRYAGGLAGGVRR